MTIRIITHGEDGRLELMAIDVEFMDAACKQTCAEGDKGGAKLFVEGYAGKLRENEICHRKLDVLFGSIAPDASDDGVAVFTCSNGNGKGGGTEDLPGLSVVEQSVKMDISGDMCETHVMHINYIAVLRE